MTRDELGMLCPVWAGPMVLALLAWGLVWGSRFVPAESAAQTIAMGGFACAFFAVRGIWGLPGRER